MAHGHASSARRLAALAMLWAAGACLPAGAAPQIDDRSLARVTAYGERTEVGSGFVIASGDIVTAYHVVQGARRIDVVLAGVSHRDVEVVAVRPETDIALLRVPRSSGAFYRVGDVSSAPPGTAVYVHGVPLGFERQLLVGRLTQAGYLRSQQWADREGRTLFQVRDLSLIPLDITAEPGLSGGPVLDESGAVFGVFSGSLQAGGRGYAWAVPMYYVDPARMQRIGKRASAIAAWPPFPYLRPGLSLLRSLNPNSEAGNLARHCRERIDEYVASWEAQLDVGYHASMKFGILKPEFDAVIQNRAGESVAARKSKFGFLWETLQPQLDAFMAAQQKFEASTARLLSACFSFAMANALLPKDVPATRRNLVLDKLWGRRIATFNAERRRNVAVKRAALEKRTQGKMQELLTLVQRGDKADDAQLIQIFGELVPLLESAMEAFLSKDQAAYIATMVDVARTWAEILEGIESQEWERGHSTYDYQDPSGIQAALRNGWLNFDKELREAVLAEGKSMPQEIKFVRFGLLSNELPQAFGELYWRPSSAPPTSVSLAVAVGDADRAWRSLQQREGMTVANSRRYQNPVGNDLLIEYTGDGQISGKPVRLYSAHRIAGHGTATLHCFLLEPTLGYENCTELTDSLRLPP